MSFLRTLQFRASLLSVVILLVFLGIWALSTTAPSVGAASAGMTAEQIEYAKMMGKDPGALKSSTMTRK